MVNSDAIFQLHGTSKQKYSNFPSANDVLMRKITKWKPQVVFQYGFRSFKLQHRNTVNRLVQ